MVGLVAVAAKTDVLAAAAAAAAAVAAAAAHVGCGDTCVLASVDTCLQLIGHITPINLSVET